jgi:hypothetical protein
MPDALTMVATAAEVTDPTGRVGAGFADASSQTEAFQRREI